MRIVLWIVVLCDMLMATAVRDVKIASNDALVEITFELNSKFASKVFKQDFNGFSSIILKNTQYNKDKISATTKLIRQIEILGQNEDVYIIFAVDNFDLNYSLSVLNADNILKIQLQPKSSIASSLLSNSNSLESAIGAIKNQTNPQNLSYTPAQLETWRYVAVIGILVALLVALVVVKRKMYAKNKEFSYFKNSPLKKNSTNVSIKHIINIDLKNKIIILDSKKCEYLLFIGEHNSFIVDRVKKDIYEDSAPKSIEKAVPLSYLLKDYYESK